MPNIQGGGGYIPQPIQPQRQVQQAQVQAVKAEAPQTELAPKDTLKMQGPTQTSTTSQASQRLTSDETKSQIHQLIQRAEPQIPQEKPQLQMMQKPAMGSALAEMLKNHHVAEQAPNPQQQAQQQASQPNQHAQTAAGNMLTSTLVRGRDTTEDTVARNDAQSGKRARKQDQEGEFSSLEDFGGGGGGMSGEGGQDGRSDSQKKKQILTLEEKRKAPAGARPTQVTAPPGAPKVIMNKTTVTPTPPKPPAPKPAAPKPTIQRVQPPLSQQQKPAPPIKKTDEWTI